MDAVFLGDSITEGWARTDAEFFSKGNVGRGISAQTTPQLLVRMHADVIALKPRVVHIMAGTNDIAQQHRADDGAGFAEQRHGDVRDREGAQAAHRARRGAAGVEILVEAGGCSRKPAALALNEWLRGYAKQIGATYADYAAVLTDGKRRRKTGIREGRGASDAGGLRRDAPGGGGGSAVAEIGCRPERFGLKTRARGH